MTAISLINLKTTEEITLVLEVSCQGNTNGALPTAWRITCYGKLQVFKAE